MSSKKVAPLVTPPADAAVLKAIAHPVRLRIYEVLVAGGPSTNARLSQHIDAAPGSLSYHLQRLAQMGFIVEAPDMAHDGRERWWRAVPGGLHWSEESLHDEQSRSAGAAAQAVLLRRQVDRMWAWVNTEHARWSLRWRSASLNTDAVLGLTPAELKQLSDEMEQLLEVWRKRSREREQPKGAASVFVAVHAFPFSPAEAPEHPAPVRRSRRSPIGESAGVNG